MERAAAELVRDALVTTTPRAGTGPEGVLVNAIAPRGRGYAAARGRRRDADVSLDEIRRSYAAGTPLRPIGRPDESAALVASWAVLAIVGQVFQPNAGTSGASDGRHRGSSRGHPVVARRPRMVAP